MADFLKLSKFKNNLGKLVYRKATDAVRINVSPVPVVSQITGKHSLQITGSELKAGMYVMVVNISGVIQSKKIVKVQ